MSPFRILFCHDPEMFRLKIVQSWFSTDFVEYKYTANGGLTWKYIHTSTPPLFGLSSDWEWGRLCHRLTPRSNFDSEKEMFGSYRKILDYEAKERKKYLDGDRKHKTERKEHHHKKQLIIEQANGK